MQALIALGANLALDGMPPEGTLRAALAALDDESVTVGRVSQFYRTPCFPAGAGPDYVNAAARLDLSGKVDATAVLARLHAVEHRFGRTRGVRWGGRTLDLDLLALDDSVLPDAATQDRWRNLPPADQALATPDRLILPHPRLQDRAFVLVPLADVAPDWVHPRLGADVATLLARLPAPDRAAVTPLHP
jgi:2-amino-4-hydroxy-6-hydroxymethyldihydropteridine diphosphokinase